MSEAAAKGSSELVSRNVEHVEACGRQREGGGFVVRRSVGGVVRNVDPFLMLDHMGPSEYGALATASRRTRTYVFAE